MLTPGYGLKVNRQELRQQISPALIQEICPLAMSKLDIVLV